LLGQLLPAPHQFFTATLSKCFQKMFFVKEDWLLKKNIPELFIVFGKINSGSCWMVEENDKVHEEAAFCLSCVSFMNWLQ